MIESRFQSGLIQDLKYLFDGCIILKNDPSYLQGVPDLLILFHDQWAALEVKRSLEASRQSNQEYYVDLMDHMSFAAFICPENKGDVLRALQYAFGLSRPTRVS